MKEQQTHGLFPFRNMGQGPTHIDPGPYLPRHIRVEEFGELARAQLTKWEKLVSAGYDYGQRFSTNPEDYLTGDDFGPGEDIRTVIREADHCWRRKWIEGVFDFHPTIQTHAELRSWCQLQFEALRVLDDLRVLADYQATYEDRPRANHGQKRDPMFSLEDWRWLSCDDAPEGRIVFRYWTCEDTIRLALPALYKLDLPLTRTDSLAKMLLEDRHFRDILGHALSWSEWTRHVQRFREETEGICPSKSHEQPITFGELFERAWEYMRQLPGRFLPKEPRRVTILGDARRHLDRVIHWCDQEEVRLNPRGKSTPSKLANPDEKRPESKEVLDTTAPGKQQEVGKNKPGSRRRRRMTLAAANSKASELAKSDPAFLTKSLREWANAIGCSDGQVARLDLWIAKQKAAGHKAKQPKSPKTVTLTEGLLAVTPADGDDPLKRLIREQQADPELSPLDPDAPDKRCRIRLHKKL
jgi:hypothetical protein